MESAAFVNPSLDLFERLHFMGAGYGRYTMSFFYLSRQQTAEDEDEDHTTNVIYFIQAKWLGGMGRVYEREGARNHLRKVSM